jgi:hypothetical protein
MDEASIRREVSLALRAMGFTDYHPPDIAKMGMADFESGRPDLIGVNPVGPSIYVEVKHTANTQNDYFDPRLISYGQRRWLDWWVYTRQGPGFLAIGTLRMPRRLWIIPWNAFVPIEKELASYGEDPTQIPSHMYIASTFYEAFSLYEFAMKTDQYTFKRVWQPLYRHPLEDIHRTFRGYPTDWATLEPVSLRPPKPEPKR